MFLTIFIIIFTVDLIFKMTNGLSLTGVLNFYCDPSSQLFVQ